MKSFTFSAALLVASAAAVPLLNRLSQQDSATLTSDDPALSGYNTTDQELDVLYQQFASETLPTETPSQEDWIDLTTDTGNEATYPTTTTQSDDTKDLALPELIDYEIDAQPELDESQWLNIDIAATTTAPEDETPDAPDAPEDETPDTLDALE